MNRCNEASPLSPLKPARRLAIALALVMAGGGFAGAQQNPMQSVRPFPPAAQRGVMVVTQPPVMLLDDKVDRLSPGARIRGTNNMLVMSGSLIGQKLVVNYVREPGGMVHEVWILTQAEAALKLPTQK